MPKVEKELSHSCSVGACRAGVRRRVFTYTVADTDLEHGSSLGNASAWATSKGTGAIQSLFSTRIGMEVTGSMVINFFAKYRDLLEHESVGRKPVEGGGETIVRLAHAGAGSFTLHPAYQEHSYDLIGDIHVTKTFYLPNTGFDDEAVVMQLLQVENQSDLQQTLLVIGCLSLVGQTRRDVVSTFDEGIGAIVAHNDSHSDWVRAFGSVPKPDGFLVTHDVEEAWNPRYPLQCKAEESGDTMAAVQNTITLNPGETTAILYVIAFTPEGSERMRAIYREVSESDGLLDRTISHYKEVLDRASIMTPDSLINQGTQWCKANMVRVLAKYPTGIAFTNDPGRSSNIVCRDASWFVYGSDYFLPEAACNLLAEMARHQKDSGMIVEYYNALNDSVEDYGLNINDDTPLFILAAAHHLDVTGHTDCGDKLYPAMLKAAEYIISQQDDRGLVYCSATGTGAHGIAGWRNIIPNRAINGAVTEVNSEAYGALFATARIAKQRGDSDKHNYLCGRAQALREAMNKHLTNPNNGLYYLNIDVHGNAISQVTADLVFPMIFGVADDSTSRRIRLRLSNEDFMTEAGLRTSSSLDPYYTPDTLSGLQGGVWPGVTWWYAMASVKDDPPLMVDSLKRSYQQYIVRPPAYNTVPGQFSEWFDGESLVNHGMRLSPWEPPRFLWAMVEGAVGLDLSSGDVRVDPRIPYEWKWLRVDNLRLSQGRLGFFAARHQDTLTIYTASSFLKAARVELYDKDLTTLLDTISMETTASAFSRDKEVVVCLANTSSDKMPAPFRTGELLEDAKEYKTRVYQSETGEWLDMGTYTGKDLDHLSIEIEAHGYAIFTFLG